MNASAFSCWEMALENQIMSVEVSASGLKAAALIAPLTIALWYRPAIAPLVPFHRYHCALVPLWYRPSFALWYRPSTTVIAPFTTATTKQGMRSVSLHNHQGPVGTLAQQATDAFISRVKKISKRTSIS